MKQNDNIEQLFKETFERFEADVNPKVWTHVQHGIQSAPAGGIVSSVAKFTLGKILAGAASVAVIAGSVWYFTTSDNKTNSISSIKQNQTEISSKDPLQNITNENQASEATPATPLSEKQTASSSHPSSSDKAVNNQNKSQNISEDANNAITENTSKAENSASAPPLAHKYGNAPQGPTPMLRGNQVQNSQPKALNNNSNANDPTTEQAPVAAIFASTESGDAPLTVVFSNQGNASSLNWDFGDGSTAKENSPSHIFNKPGNYVVKLSAKNSAGNASDKISIEVKSISDILSVPNIFTPNGDGIDDFFYFETKNIASMQVTIFDIRGTKIISSWAVLDGKWDGRTNGIDAPEGVYLYTIQATGTDGMIHTKKGSVTLKRSSQ